MTGRGCTKRYESGTTNMMQNDGREPRDLLYMWHVQKGDRRSVMSRRVTMELFSTKRVRGRLGHDPSQPTQCGSGQLIFLDRGGLVDGC